MNNRENKVKTKYLLAFASAVISLILLAGCSSYSSQAPAASAPASQTAAASSAPAAVSSNQAAVSISGFAFSSPTLTVAKGTTVTWTNNDSPTHTVTSDSGVWDSGNLSPGKSFSFTFNQVGTFPYHCNIHSSMTAKIIVQ
jgi:plastocyanin